MSEYYSINIPNDVLKNINEASLYVSNKAKVDVNNKFIPEKYKFHMTFIYFGPILKEPSIQQYLPAVNDLILNQQININFDFEDIDLFGRFVVARYKIVDINDIKEKLLLGICDILGDKIDASLFCSKNYYDLASRKFTRIWNPHITIGSIRTPSAEYCARKNISVQDCMNGSYKDIRRYLSPFFQKENMSFTSNSLC